MQVGLSYKQRAPEGAFDAIVIGSGIGGLACASALARYEDLQSRGAHMMAAVHLSSHGAAIARAKALRPS